MSKQASALLREISACTLCAENLPLGPRPIVQFSPKSRILIIGQAPGTRVHASGVPWDDDSGDRLRDWLGMEKDAFYDPDTLALMPMGFCYPGKAKSGDAPPRKECAPAWHDQILALLPQSRLTLLVGTYAQTQYLPETRRLSLTQRVQSAWLESPELAAEGSKALPLPHPSWRVRMWMAKHHWYEADVLPRLRKAVAAQLV